jgi:multicomponent K+:H+ antiporter subunit A
MASMRQEQAQIVLGLIVLLPFLGSVCAAFLRSNARNIASWLTGSIAAACVLLVASLYPVVADGGRTALVLEWLPQAGLNVQLRIDGYAWLFAMLVTGMGALVVVYARYYMSAADPVPRFFSFLLAFMGAMLGIVLSGNLIQLVIFWELTSFTSFMLIAYWYHLADARRGASMALTVTAAGGLCLLAGVMMIGKIVGSYDLDEVLASAELIKADAWYPAITALVALGALTKSAQFPFHFWLPHAMAAPTPVSAYLHSATMVKAGVFLLGRFWPVLAGTEIWFWVIGGAGLATLLFGAYAAIFQRDMKGVLAYSTISHLGLITLLLGMNSELALVAAVFHMMNHATFKASLFMATGIVDHETGTRDLQRLSGLSRFMPITATVTCVTAAAMAGVPLLNGFLSKEMFFAVTVTHSESWRVGLPALATIAGAFSVAYSLRFVRQVFFGRVAQSLPRAPHDPTLWMLMPSALLGLACVLVGIFPERTIGPMLQAAVYSMLGPRMPQYSLVVWHGFTLPLLMSSIALVGGFALYVLLVRLPGGAHRAAPLIERFDGKRLFAICRVNAIRASGRLKRIVSSRRLQPQIRVIILCALAGASVVLLKDGLYAGAVEPSTLDLSFALLWLVGAACAIGAALHAKYHRLAALIMLSGAGLVTCVTFAWVSAPDLALTQIIVEVVTTVLLLLGLRWLPKRIEMQDEARRHTLTARARRARDLLIAAVVGAGLSAVTYGVLTRPSMTDLPAFFLDRSLLEAAGRNVVNVILVDFRGFDTFGEITVVGIVALTVYALLRRFRPAPESIAVPRAQLDDEASVRDPNELLPSGFLELPAVLTRLTLPLAALVSLFFLLRGHNAPGGGFVGGLVLATAVLVQYMIAGTHWVEARTNIHPPYWVAVGLLLAAVAGMTAWPFDGTFLTSTGGSLSLPLLGDVHIATTLLFDIGVYMVVAGSAVLMLIALAHQSMRSANRAFRNKDEVERGVER